MTISKFYLFLLSAFAALVLSTNVFAVTKAPVIIDSGEGGCIPDTEICGDGIDQNCDGSDTLCDGSDKDRDGYSTDDCDDSNRRVFPGVSISCNEVCQGGYKTCQSSGQMSECICQPLCEAPAGSKCYYLSPLVGSDSNNGSFTAPWKTTSNFKYYWDTAAPQGWVNLQPGDVVYLMSGQYSINSSPIDLSRRKGTADKPIKIKGYPGAIAVIAPTLLDTTLPSYGIQLYQSQYIVIEDIEIAKSKTLGVYITEAKGIEVKNCIIHDIWGSSSDNLAGISVTAAESSRFHHNIFYDNYDRSRAWASGTDIILFGGGNNRVDHNIFYTSNAVATDVQVGAVLHKHTATVANQTFEVDHNIVVKHIGLSFGTGSSNSRIHHNLIINSTPLGSINYGGPTLSQEIYFENNTLINSRGLFYSPTDAYGAVGKFYFRKNIILDNRSNSGENSVISVGEYDSDSLYNQVVTGKLLDINSNCYYNSGTQSFRLFAGQPTTTGQSYSFSAWKGLGYDTASIEANPNLNSSYRPSNTSCTDKGWLAE